MYYVEFLDECLETYKDNIFQENLFTVFTSMEMVSLWRVMVMASAHYTICMPMRCLAGNAHHINTVGYDWSAQSMGKATDALHDAMVEIETDSSKLLDETFMNTFLSKD